MSAIICFTPEQGAGRILETELASNKCPAAPRFLLLAGSPLAVTPVFRESITHQTTHCRTAGIG
jgi:hypothetical protein